MSRRVRFKADLARLVSRALSEGATITGLGRVHWDLSADCERPFAFTLEGRDPAFGHAGEQHHARPSTRFIGDGFDGVGPYPGGPLWLDMEVPCRKCSPCLKRRAAAWAYRASAEIDVAPRTWFGTMTLSPESAFLLDCRASKRLAARGVAFAKLSASEQFRERANEGGAEITKWLKRIRKESGAKLRYCLVVEAHKSGAPHWHILVHESHPNDVVRHRTLSAQWSLGFSNFKLLDGSRRAAWYVCKYLSKQAMARVRASQAYGKNPLDG